MTSESDLHRSNQPPKYQEHPVQISARSNGQLIKKHDLNFAGRRKRLQQKNLFPSLFSLVESSLKNLSYVLMYFKDNINEQLNYSLKTILYLLNCAFPYKAKTNYKQDYNSNPFPNRIGNQIKTIIPILFQVG